jgi:hypothetical protein|tara:strand:+ start:841 stop:1047 length:207 start_codon:yes stop_codon:yes gene_type:complete
MNKEPKPRGRPRKDPKRLATPDDYGERLNIRVDPGLKQRMAELAQKHEHSAAAEWMAAAYSWLDAEQG